MGQKMWVALLAIGRELYTVAPPHVGYGADSGPKSQPQDGEDLLLLLLL